LLQSLAQILHSRRNIHSARPIAHFDNATHSRSARTENCFEGCRFRHAFQPPDSSDVSPCDFSLFGDLRTKLKGEEFEMLKELQERLKERVGRITAELTEWIYENSIERLTQIINSNGGYVQRRLSWYEIYLREVIAS
jgi:hypothetical protein